jgi:hypothetical protein
LGAVNLGGIADSLKVLKGQDLIKYGSSPRAKLQYQGIQFKQD